MSVLMSGHNTAQNSSGNGPIASRNRLTLWTGTDLGTCVERSLFTGSDSINSWQSELATDDIGLTQHHIANSCYSESKMQAYYNKPIQTGLCMLMSMQWCISRVWQARHMPWRH